MASAQNAVDRAIFLDRDGTLVYDVGHLGTPDDIRLYPDTIPALLRLQRSYLLFVVTNQSGVAHGRITRAQVDAVNENLAAMLAAKGVHIRRWYVCPHSRADACCCMKPKPQFLLQAAEEFGLRLDLSFVIGDHPHDPATADSVGAFGVYLLTGHGSHHLAELPHDRLLFHSLGDAARWIEAHPDPRSVLAREIQSGAEAIRAGGLVAFPTETVYGLGADALNPRAVARIFEVKERPLEDPLIVHIAEPGDLAELAAAVPEKAQRLAESFWPGPLTIVLPKRPTVPDIVTAGLPTIAVRMPANGIARQLIRLAGVPIAAPSANRFGRTSPTAAAHVVAQLGTGWGVVIDGGACRVGLESTVLSLAAGDKPVLLRPGAVTLEQLGAVIGEVEDPPEQHSHRPESPGMFERHYAPVTPLLVVRDVGPFRGDAGVGVLFFRPREYEAAGPAEVLTQSGALDEAAVNLYAALRRLDSVGLKLIVAESVPDHGIGRAINDRLRKAGSYRGGGPATTVPC